MNNKDVVAIVDDDDAIRESVGLVLESIGLTTRAYPSALAFLDDPDAGDTACLILDLRMPGISGVELQRRLRSIDGDLPIIFISGHGDVNTAVEVMKRGAVDFLQKPFSNQVLIDNVQAAIAHSRGKRESISRCEAYRQRLATLTRREREIFDALGSGRVPKQIADDLGISIRTVEEHRTHVFAKLSIRRTSELTALATELKLASD